MSAGRVLLATCMAGILVTTASVLADSDIPTVPGFADLHNHMMAEYAYGGAS